MKNKILLSLFFSCFFFLGSVDINTSVPVNDPSILSDVKEIAGEKTQILLQC